MVECSGSVQKKFVSLLKVRKVARSRQPLWGCGLTKNRDVCKRPDIGLSVLSTDNILSLAHSSDAEMFAS